MIDKIVFVCTGNTCRSPMAEYLMMEKLRQTKLSIEVISRGLGVNGLGQANPKACTVMKECYNVDLSHHESKVFTQDDITEDTLILTMTEHHRNYLFQVYHGLIQQRVSHLATIKEWVGKSGDVHDPFGGDIHTYEGCVAELDWLLDSVIALLQEISET